MCHEHGKVDVSLLHQAAGIDDNAHGKVDVKTQDRIATTRAFRMRVSAKRQ
jgi:hypothetical protein